MADSRKEWITRYRTGERLGWFGPARAPDAVAIRLARDPEEPFDTIVVTELPEAGLSLFVEFLIDGGRLLVIAPFGEVYPSRLVELLRPCSVPVHFDLIDHELRLAVEKRRTTPGAWRLLASPGRQLEITEQGTDELEARRNQELDTLRSAYYRLAERLMRREEEKAGPSVATATHLHSLEEKIGDLQEAIQSLEEAPETRVGRALLAAAKNPFEALRLPRRLLTAYVDSRQKPAPRLTSSAPITGQIGRLVRSTPQGLALLVDGRVAEEAEGLDRQLAIQGWAVLLAAATESTGMRPAATIVRSTLPRLLGSINSVERLEVARRVAIFRSPHPDTPRLVNRLNAWGWYTIYDCFEAWPERLATGTPHRYRRSIERFLVHNVDAVCATSDEARRLSEMFAGSVTVADTRSDVDRAEAITALVGRLSPTPDKQLHSRESA